MSRISETDLILNPDGSVYHLGLVPDVVSDLIITVGDPERVAKVSRYFDHVENKIQRREFVTHTGRVGNRHLSVISTGIGTDNVEIALNELDALVNVDLAARRFHQERKKITIIRIGTSGSLQSDVPVGAHLVSDFAVGFDSLMSFYELPQDDFESGLATAMQDELQLPFRPYVSRAAAHLVESIGDGMIRGNTVTSPGFYAPQGRKLYSPVRFPDLLKKLIAFRADNFRLDNFEMETSGYYALGNLMGHNVVSVNAILANRATDEFSKKPDVIVDSLIKKVLERL